MHAHTVTSGPSAVFTVFGYIADIAAALAAIAAVTGLIFAWSTVAMAAEERRRAERARVRDHMWRIYRRVTNTHALARSAGVSGGTATWESMAASLREAMTGLEAVLPLCAKIPYARSPNAAVLLCKAAEPEIRGVLDRFEREAVEEAVPDLRRWVKLQDAVDSSIART